VQLTYELSWAIFPRIQRSENHPAGHLLRPAGAAGGYLYDQSKKDEQKAYEKGVKDCQAAKPKWRSVVQVTRPVHRRVWRTWRCRRKSASREV